MPISIAPSAFPPISAARTARAQKLLFDLMQKMGAYSATIFISTLPFVGRLMHSSGNHVQLTLTVFFVGSIVGELLAGPLSKIIGCKHIFLLGAAFYIASAVVIRCSSVPGLLLAARIVQAIGAMASIAVTVYSFYSAAPVLPIKALANPTGSFRHLFMVLTAGIIIGGLTTGLGSRMTNALFLVWSLPAALAAFFRPLIMRVTKTVHATKAKVAHIYARHELSRSPGNLSAFDATAPAIINRCNAGTCI